MRTIYKYPLHVGRNEVEMPRNPQWLHVGEQQGQMMVWAAVEESESVHTYTINVVGTGADIPAEQVAFYIGTVQMNGYVWHAFFIRP